MALMALAALSGCIVYESPDPAGGALPPQSETGNPGDVVLNWSFAGRSCWQMPEVRSVQVTIPGESLENGGVYPCSSGGVDGIRLASFSAGSYELTLRGLGSSGQMLFSASVAFRVDGDASVRLDLAPVGGMTSYAFLYWSFPALDGDLEPSCEQAGIDWVDVSIDGAPWVRYACSEGTSEAGAQTPMLDSGRHSIELVAIDSLGYDWYAARSVLDTRVGQPSAAEYSLQWSVGGAAVGWQLTDGSYGESCWQAGVDSVYVNFEDEAGNMVFEGSGDLHPCDASLLLYTLRPGSYRVFVTATGPYGALYVSNEANPPVVYIDAGVFPDESWATTVQLYRVY
jgi:hypothetical protein